jgi:glycosyltransferase involved in cell wall biosynthesis
MVSVVMTIHATAPSLVNDAVQSILWQTMTDFELIIVVDGRIGDRLSAVLSELDGDERVRIIRPGKVGRGVALNLGLAAARAPLIAIQDSDDESHPQRFERQLDVLRRSPAIDLLATGCVRTYSREDHADWELPDDRGTTEVVDRQLLTRNMLVHTSVIVRAELFERLDGYAAERIRYFDYDLYLRARDAGAHLALLSTPLVLQRFHEQQSFGSERRLLRQMKDLFRLQLAHVRHEPPLVRFWYTLGLSARIPIRFARSEVRRRRRLGGSKPDPRP